MAKAVIQNSVLIPDGNVVVGAGAQIEIKNAETDSLATLWQDRDGNSSQSNPFNADDNGHFRVYANPGRYNVTATLSGSGSKTWDDVIAWDSAGNLENMEGVDTYTELKALSGVTGNVYVRGRSSVGDGGEGTFIWDGSDLSTEVGADEVTSSEGDGGIYVAPDSDETGVSGAWVRQFNGSYWTEWYGAVGDGSTDDITAIQQAVDSRSLSGGGIVELDAKDYRLKSRLNLKQGVFIVGQSSYPGDLKLQDNNKDATRLLTEDTSTHMILAEDGENNWGLVGLVIKPNSVTFPQSQTDVAAWSGTAVRGHGSNGCLIRDCLIGGYGTGIQIDNNAGSATNSARNVYDHLWMDCLNCINNSDSVDVDYYYTVHCWPALSNQSTTVDDLERTGNGIHIQSAGGWQKLINCSATGWNVGILLTDTVHVKATNCATDYVGTPNNNPSPAGFKVSGTSATYTSLTACSAGGPVAFAVVIDCGSGIEAANSVMITGMDFGNTVDTRHINIVSADTVAVTNSIFNGGINAFYVGSDMGLNLSVSNCRFNNQNTLVNNGGAGFSTNTVNWDHDTNVITGLNNLEWNNPVDIRESLASSNTITLPTTTDFIDMTGTTNIGTITNRLPGRRVTLHFNNTLDLVTSGNIVTKDGANKTVNANDTVTLICQGSNWYET